MKLYTKRGDDGQTDLFGGTRVDKDSLRVTAFGSVDELNSAVGLAAAGCRSNEIAAPLRVIQERLFELGADLATPRRADESSKAGASAIPRIDDSHAAEAEAMIDRAWAPLPAMKHFVLPGGCELSARLHMARSICRRAERDCLALSRVENVGTPILIYLNRLSDLLFALARRANQLEGVEDVPWIGPRGK